MIEEQISLIDEDYIVNLSNKGMYKRALKAMDKEDISLLSQWVFKVADETVEFSGKLEKFNCTCPATSYCKHVIMSYIYMMNNLQKDMEKVSLSLDDFDSINGLTNKDIRSFSNQKSINDVLLDYKFENISHEIESLLKIYLGNGTQVNFTYPFDIEEAFRVNGEKEVIMAIKYIQSLKGVENIKVEFKIANKEILEEVVDYLENLLGIGLYTIKESEIDKLEFLCIKLRLEKYNFLFKKIKYLIDSVKKYISGDIDSGIEFVKRQIIDILFDIYTLLGNGEDYEKYRLFRRSSYKSEISEINGYGISYEIVNLKNKEKLINMILIDNDNGELYEISNLRKNIIHKNISSMPLFFQNSISADSLLDKSFKIKNVSLKEKNRISNSTKIGIDFLESHSINMEDYVVSISNAIENFLEGDQRCFILSDKIDGFNNFRFREEVQRFEIWAGAVATYFKYEEEADKETICRLKHLNKIDYMLVKLNKIDFHIDVKIVALWSNGEKIILRES